MATVNNTRFVILGLLSLSDKSGYDIKKEVSSQMDHFWSESYGKIYPMLRMLEKEKAIEKEVEKSDGKPDRYVYHLTKTGEKQLKDWMKTDIVSLRGRNELLLRLYLGKNTSKNVLINHVKDAKKRREEDLEFYTGMKQKLNASKDDHTPYHLITVEYELAHSKSYIGWCKEALKELERM